MMVKFIHKLASPKYFYHLSGKLLPWLMAMCLLFFLLGLVQGLIYAPVDYQQGHSYRIMFIHVPSAWMSLMIYIIMATAGAIFLIWKIKLAAIIASSSATIGAAFTFIALVTGALWGKPMWGTYWAWDARLTSELILLFLYLGYIALEEAIDDPRSASKACAVLVLVGVVNIPIIHYSVEWWYTLHQGASVSKLDTPSIHISMLIPLLLMTLACKCYYALTILMQARNKILWQEQNTHWVRALITENQSKG